MKKEKRDKRGTLPATEKDKTVGALLTTKKSNRIAEDSVTVSKKTSIGQRATEKGKLNVIRIEDDSGNAQINLNENSVNVILVTNTGSRKIKITCGKNSKTRYIEINNSKNKAEVKREIFLQKNAALNFYNLYAGKGNQSSSTTAELLENSVISMKNILIAERQEHAHDIKVIHRERNSKSNLQSRGVLSDSKINLKGLIKIEEKAEESEGYQKSDMLMLKDSEVVSVPDLEIHNNKVKCSHGSSITRLDSKKIFYLQARGLDEESSKSLLTRAFFSEIMSDLEKNEGEEMEIIIDTKLSAIEK